VSSSENLFVLILCQIFITSYTSDRSPISRRFCSQEKYQQPAALLVLIIGGGLVNTSQAHPTNFHTWVIGVRTTRGRAPTTWCPIHGTWDCARCQTMGLSAAAGRSLCIDSRGDLSETTCKHFHRGNTYHNNKWEEIETSTTMPYAVLGTPITEDMLLVCQGTVLVELMYGPVLSTMTKATTRMDWGGKDQRWGSADRGGGPHRIQKNLGWWGVDKQGRAGWAKAHRAHNTCRPYLGGEQQRG
jgi:hypothetical protein